MLLYALILFLAGTFTDITWALYIRKVAEHKRLSGALYSVGTGLCTVIIIEGIITNIWLFIPWLFGLFVGTYFSDDVEKSMKNFVYWSLRCLKK